MTSEQWSAYTKALRKGGFVKLARLRFLNPDGSSAFTLDNNPYNQRSRNFIRSGSVSCNLQNGARWTADVTLANLDGEYDYNVNHVWFGTEIAIDMGMVIEDGSPEGFELYFPMGIYRVERPSERVQHNGRTAQFSLTDKWAGLDGTLNGALEASYVVNEGTNIFTPIRSILQMDRGDGEPYDGMVPVFTEYYNGQTQALPGGGTASLTDAPYTLIVDNDSGTVAEVILGLCGMVNAWVGYDRTGRLRVDPSQDDLLDTEKPVAWRFLMNEAQITGELAYESQISEVYNDYIVTGNMTADYLQPAARATNNDPRSPTAVSRIGRRTKRDPKPEFATYRMCADYAEWKVKRTAALHKAVTVNCNQIFHMEVNQLIEIVRTDLDRAEIERHLVQGFTIPLSGTEPMSITAVSVHDFPTVAVTDWGNA